MTAALSSLSLRATELILRFGRAILFAVFVAMFIAVLYPNLRSAIRTTLVHEYRTIVSTARGDLIGNGSELTVAKVLTHEGMFLEIYQGMEDGGQRLVERLELSDKKDGYFNFNGQATNLAIDDIDGDGLKEILVPSFDQNLIGHLNIYRFNATQGAFQRSML